MGCNSDSAKLLIPLDILNLDFFSRELEFNFTILNLMMISNCAQV